MINACVHEKVAITMIYWFLYTKKNKHIP